MESTKKGFCPECWIGISGHEEIIGKCVHCHATWDPASEERIDEIVDDAFEDDDSEEFITCSDCDGHDACQDFGCYIKLKDRSHLPLTDPEQ